MGKRTQEQKKNTVKPEADVLHDYSDIQTERNYKDRLFRQLFGSEQYKENLLELYNDVGVKSPIIVPWKFYTNPSASPKYGILYISI